jgi:hypothetical protein
LDVKGVKECNVGAELAGKIPLVSYTSMTREAFSNNNGYIDNNGSVKKFVLLPF